MSAKLTPGPGRDGTGRGGAVAATSGPPVGPAGWSEGAEEGSAGCGRPGPRKRSGSEARWGPQTREPSGREWPLRLGLRSCLTGPRPARGRPGSSRPGHGGAGGADRGRHARPSSPLAHLRTRVGWQPRCWVLTGGWRRGRSRS